MSEPICPRCGYDQSGAAASWETSCPLKGTCSECGQELVWADVFDPTRVILPGCFEYAGRSVFESAKNALRTLVWVLTFRLCWKLRLTHAVSLRRACLWLLIVVTSAHALSSVVASASFVAAQLSIGAVGAIAITGQNSEVSEAVSCWTLPFVDVWTGKPTGIGSFSERTFSALFIFVLGCHAMMFLLMVGLPYTREKYKIRTAHVFRAWVYGSAWLALPLLTRGAGELVRVVEAEHSIGIFWPGGGLIHEPRQLLNIALLIALLWLWVWWLLVLIVQWRVREGWYVLCVLSVPTVLGGAVACVVYGTLFGMT